MSERGDLPCPVMRGGAGLHPDEARRQLKENSRTAACRSFLFRTTAPPASTPWSWKTDMARSIPSAACGRLLPSASSDSTSLARREAVGRGYRWLGWSGRRRSEGSFSQQNKLLRSSLTGGSGEGRMGLIPLTLPSDRVRKWGGSAARRLGKRPTHPTSRIDMGAPIKWQMARDLIHPSAAPLMGASSLHRGRTNSLRRG